MTFALPAESSEFLRRLANKSQSDRNGVRIVRGNIGDRDVEVLHTGVGEKACRERLRKFLEDQKFALLISSGFAGALNDEFEIGDLLLAKNFSTIELKKDLLGFVQSCAFKYRRSSNNAALIDSSDERNKPRAPQARPRSTWRRNSSRAVVLNMAFRCFRFVE